MKNSLLLHEEVMRIWCCICEDAKLAYPDQVSSLDRDIRRLVRLVEERGMGVFTHDLPNLDAILLEGLETGRLPLRGALTGHAGAKVPNLLKGLWLRIFDETGCVKVDSDTTAIFFVRQLACLGKKLVSQCTPERVTNTLKEYINVEKQCRAPTLSWEGDDIGPDCTIRSLSVFDALASYSGGFPLLEEPRSISSDLSTSLRRFQRLCDWMATSVFPTEFDAGDFAIASVAEGRRAFAHGPGVTAEGAHLRNKFRFESWPLKLQRLYPYEVFGTTQWESLPIDSRVEHPSRVIAVPKDAKKPRLIAAEPTYYMWVQQCQKAWIESCIEKSPLAEFINFRRQDLSRLMAQRCSVHRKYVTVDLSSASDRLSSWVVERAWRQNPLVLRHLHASRTRWSSYTIDGEESFFVKRKFASQGTAVTFPVQTIVYLLACLASLPGLYEGDSVEEYVKSWKGKVRVFGDDMIVPKEGYERLCALLDYLGLKVNVDKTFVRGHFRESCGGDFYRGDDVTPLKPKSIDASGPDGVLALVDFSNNLFKKGLWRTAEYVRSTVPRCESIQVCTHDRAGLAFYCFSGNLLPAGVRRRYNQKLHREEAYLLTYSQKVNILKQDQDGKLLEFFHRPKALVLNSDLGVTKRSASSLTRRWVPVEA